MDASRWLPLRTLAGVKPRPRAISGHPRGDSSRGRSGAPTAIATFPAPWPPRQPTHRWRLPALRGCEAWPRLATADCWHPTWDWRQAGPGPMWPRDPGRMEAGPRPGAGSAVARPRRRARAGVSAERETPATC